MDKTEARQKIRRAADALAATLTQGQEDYDVYAHKIDVTTIESERKEYAYQLIIRAVTEEEF